MGDYEYRVMSRVRTFYTEDGYWVLQHGYTPGWSDWTEWREFTNRSGRKCAYSTLAAARGVARRVKRREEGYAVREIEVNIQRRPVQPEIWETMESENQDA